MIILLLVISLAQTGLIAYCWKRMSRLEKANRGCWSKYDRLNQKVCGFGRNFEGHAKNTSEKLAFLNGRITEKLGNQSSNP